MFESFDFNLAIIALLVVLVFLWQVIGQKKTSVEEYLTILKQDTFTVDQSWIPPKGRLPHEVRYVGNAMSVIYVESNRQDKARAETIDMIILKRPGGLILTFVDGVCVAGTKDAEKLHPAFLQGDYKRVLGEILQQVRTIVAKAG